MPHFEVRFLKYSGLSPVQRLKGHGEGGGGGGPSAKFGQYLAKSFVSALTSYRREKYVVTMFNILHTPCPSCNIF